MLAGYQATLKLGGLVGPAMAANWPSVSTRDRRRPAVNKQRLMLHSAVKVALPRGTPARRSSSSVQMEYGVYQMPHSQLKTPPILLLHGLNLSRAVWRRTARHMARRGSRRVFAVDARNHGRSPHAVEHTPAAMAGDVAAFIEQHNLGRIAALGHSVGGRALMTLALQKPDLVERLIVVDITPGPLPAELVKASELFKLMVNVTPTIPKEMTLAEARRFILPALGKLIRRDLELLMVIQSLRKCADGCFAWNVNAQAILDGWDETMVNYEQTLHGLAPYPGETLLIVASRERIVTASNLESMRAFFPKLQVEILNAEHKVYLDQPQKFVDLVVEFTKTCTGCKD